MCGFGRGRCDEDRPLLFHDPSFVLIERLELGVTREKFESVNLRSCGDEHVVHRVARGALHLSLRVGEGISQREASIDDEVIEWQYLGYILTEELPLSEHPFESDATESALRESTEDLVKAVLVGSGHGLVA